MVVVPSRLQHHANWILRWIGSLGSVESLAIRFSLRRFSIPYSVWPFQSEHFSLRIFQSWNFQSQIFQSGLFSLRIFQSWNFQSQIIQSELFSLKIFQSRIFLSQIFQSETLLSGWLKFFLQLLVEYFSLRFFSLRNFSLICFSLRRFSLRRFSLRRFSLRRFSLRYFIKIEVRLSFFTSKLRLDFRF